jgi:hypothetical protein
LEKVAGRDAIQLITVLQNPLFERERERERGARETSGYEPFALHAPIHWAT